MRKSRNKKLSLSASINVTPFVDVLLILLLVFMVTAPNLSSGFDVELPRASNVSAVDTKTTNVVITVSKNNSLFFNEKKITVSALKANLSNLKSDTTQVFIKAEASIPYQNVVTVINELTLLNFTNISLVAEK